jgi:Der1-like family
VHVYVVNVPAPWYPWVYLALDFVVSGPTQAAVDFIGILGAHLHLFLTEEWPRQGGRRFDTPLWFKNFFPRPIVTGSQRSFGTVFTPREQTQAAGTSTGVNRPAGNFRGQGHRLG